MEIKKILLALVSFIFLAIAGISGFVFAYSKEAEKQSTASLIEIKSPAPDPVIEPLFYPAALNWEQVSSIIPWETRDSQAVVVFQNKMWLIGGVRYDTRQLFNDVWFSTF